MTKPGRPLRGHRPAPSIDDPSTPKRPRQEAEEPPEQDVGRATPDPEPAFTLPTRPSLPSVRLGSPAEDSDTSPCPPSPPTAGPSRAPAEGGGEIRSAAAPTNELRYSLRSAKSRERLALCGIMLFSTLALAAHPDTQRVEPQTLAEARMSHYWSNWEFAMAEEFRSLGDNNTWDLVLPRSKDNVLSGKWVYKLKRGADNEVIRHKARWVVRGFEQVEGLDYFETFASVVKPMSYKALFAIAAALDLEIEQMDVKTAFLYGKIRGHLRGAAEELRGRVRASVQAEEGLVRPEASSTSLVRDTHRVSPLTRLLSDRVRLRSLRQGRSLRRNIRRRPLGSWERHGRDQEDQGGAEQALSDDRLGGLSVLLGDQDTPRQASPGDLLGPERVHREGPGAVWNGGLRPRRDADERQAGSAP